MYGIIGQFMAFDGKRDELIEILLEGTKDMPGCKLYAIAADDEDENAIWVTEIWESSEAHKKSLELPSVQEAVGKGRELIAGIGQRKIVSPRGGHGLG